MKKQRAVITGGTRGIGLAIAKTLISNNFDIAVTGKNPENLRKAADELSKIGKAAVHTIQADLLDPETPKHIVSQAADLLGGIDLLVNNAGSSLSASFEEATVDDWETIMAVNARAPYFICQEALPHLKASENPVIVQLGSVVAVKGYEKQSMYSASKHALAGFTKAMAREVYQDGIRVHMIMPGGVGTEMIKQIRPDIDPSEMLSPEEIADLVLFFANWKGNGVIDEIHIHRRSKAPWS